MKKHFLNANLSYERSSKRMNMMRTIGSLVLGIIMLNLIWLMAILAGTGTCL